MLKNRFCFVLVFALLLVCPTNTFADNSFEFYFFGVNLKAFQGSDWKKVAAGAIASILVHELGHALYLESQGKDWDLRTSFSGLAIHASESLSNEERLYFGRAGFLLQTAVGLILTSFEKTRQSDFTKGWVYTNTFEVWSYQWRDRDMGDDFELIERGGGSPNSELRFFCAMSLYNAWRIELPAHFNLPMFHEQREVAGLSSTEHLGRESDYDPDELFAHLRTRIVSPDAASSFVTAGRFSESAQLPQFDGYYEQDLSLVQRPTQRDARVVRPDVYDYDRPYEHHELLLSSK